MNEQTSAVKLQLVNRGIRTSIAAILRDEPRKGTKRVRNHRKEAAASKTDYERSKAGGAPRGSSTTLIPYPKALRKYCSKPQRWRLTTTKRVRYSKAKPK